MDAYPVVQFDGPTSPWPPTITAVFRDSHYPGHTEYRDLTGTTPQQVRDKYERLKAERKVL